MLAEFWDGASVADACLVAEFFCRWFPDSIGVRAPCYFPFSEPFAVFMLDATVEYVVLVVHGVLVHVLLMRKSYYMPAVFVCIVGTVVMAAFALVVKLEELNVHFLFVGAFYWTVEVARCMHSASYDGHLWLAIADL